MVPRRASTKHLQRGLVSQVFCHGKLVACAKFLHGVLTMLMEA